MIEQLCYAPFTMGFKFKNREFLLNYDRMLQTGIISIYHRTLLCYAIEIEIEKLI